MLDGVAHNEAVSASATITLDGLTDGKSYIAQFFIGDEREDTYGDNTEGRYINGDYRIKGGANTSSPAFLMPIRSFVGTWVADGTDQEFTIINTDFAPRGQNVSLNAVQWRNFVPPADGTVLIIK